MYRVLVCLALLCGALSAQIPDAGYADFQERWDHYVDRTFDWKRIGTVAVETALTQTFEVNKCGRPPYCFPDRFGGALMRRTTRTTIELAAGAVLREDIRRKRSGLTGLRPRLLFALKQSAMTRTPEGTWRPAYSRFAASFAAVVVSEAWDGRPMTAPHVLKGFGWSVSDYLQDSVMTEFEPDLKRMARRAWKTYVWKDRPVVAGATIRP